MKKIQLTETWYDRWYYVLMALFYAILIAGTAWILYIIHTVFGPMIFSKFVCGVLGSVIIVAVAYKIFIVIDNWFIFTGAGDYGVKTGNYNVKESVAKKIKEIKHNVYYGTSLIPGERERPPKAHFFGRLNGIPIEKDGAYEEKYLTIYELRYWNKQKEKISNISPDKEDKNEEMPLEEALSIAKSIDWHIDFE